MWAPTGGFSSAGAQAIAVNDDGVVFVGTPDQGIFRSSDDGGSWEEVNIGLGNLNVNTLQINGGVILAGTLGGGIFKSTNDGDTWEAKNAGLPNLDIIASTFTSNASVDLYVIAVGNFSGTYFSADEGDTWSVNNNGLNNTEVLSLGTSIDNQIYAGTFGGGVYRQQLDGGILGSWGEVNTNIGNFKNEAIATFGEDVVYAGSLNGVFRSTDSGDTWAATGAEVAEFEIISLAVNEDGVVFAGTLEEGLYRSDNDGASWARVENGFMADVVEDLEVTSAGDIWAASPGDGPYLSTDAGLSWSAQRISFSNEAFVHSLLVTEDNGLVAGTLSGLFLSENSGASWEDISEGLTDNDIADVVVGPDGTEYVGTHGGGMFRSESNADTWEAINEGLDNLDVGAIAITEGGTLFASTHLGGVYRSMDRGDTWSEVLNLGLNNPFVPSLLIENGTIYSGSDDGVHQSTDNGDSWTQINEGLGDLYIESLASTGDGVLFAGTDRGIYYSEDEGASWQIPTSNPVLADQVVRSITVLNRFAVFAGTHDHGVFKTGDTGATWEQMNMGLTNLDVHALTIDQDGIVYAGTEGVGVFRTEMALNVSVEEEPSEQPALFELEGNYPNPFNPQTTIRYALPEQAAVTMIIYDATGRQVGHLLNETTQTAGWHEVTFDAAVLPSGVYFYRLIAGDFSDVKQMILLK